METRTNILDSPFVDVCFLDAAKAAAATVGRVIRYGSMKGNGFMISESLFLTNHHIIHDSEDAKRSIVEFDHELDNKQRPKNSIRFNFAPDQFLLRNPEENLDFTIVAVGGKGSGDRRISDFGFCPIKQDTGRYALGESVNMIQHPGAEYKKICLRNTKLVAQSEEVLQYCGPVRSGSSGSPVFNNHFEPIAIHHSGRPTRVAFTKEGTPGPVEIAEGIRISAIVKRINSEKPKLAEEQRILIETALNYPFSHPSLLYSE